ncbi:sigma-70 family RNA polymerase sigma factor [Pseudomonas sp. EL_65y_Pfl2_R95]|uniref:sigma-70 family RNA polymerase sigma factor n=1 Tax=Pseudomonas sp. EL_65y_Pfl2_R95 TaxID=3088698 RepID=UPI0030DB2628
MSVVELSSQQYVQRLYSDHNGWLNRWLHQRLGCAHNAADLAQDTFVRLLNTPDNLATLRQPRAYLSTIAHGLMVNFWRRQSVERAYVDALAAQPEALAPSPEAREMIVETLLAIDAMLLRLPSNVRRAFLLSQLDGLTYAVIAQRLGVSERMVKKYMAQAMLHCLMLAQE